MCCVRVVLSWSRMVWPCREDGFGGGGEKEVYAE